jgi:hypothetical protein
MANNTPRIPCPPPDCPARLFVSTIEMARRVPGVVTGIAVQHEGDCPHWRGEPCRCDPGIEARVRCPAPVLRTANTLAANARPPAPH